MIDVAFSYTKLIPSKSFDVASNRRIASSSKITDCFTMKNYEYVFDADPSDMYNHADRHVFGRNFRVYFTMSKRCTVSPLLAKYSKQLDVPVVTGVTVVYLKIDRR